MHIKGQAIHPSVTADRVMEACERRMTTLNNPGLCIACGKEVMGCEPDAEGYVCDFCRAPQVYGAEELLLYFV